MDESFTKELTTCGLCGESIFRLYAGRYDFEIDFWDVISNPDINPLDLTEHECVVYRK